MREIEKRIVLIPTQNSTANLFLPVFAADFDFPSSSLPPGTSRSVAATTASARSSSMPPPPPPSASYSLVINDSSSDEDDDEPIIIGSHHRERLLAAALDRRGGGDRAPPSYRTNDAARPSPPQDPSECGVDVIAMLEDQCLGGGGAVGVGIGGMITDIDQQSPPAKKKKKNKGKKKKKKKRKGGKRNVDPTEENEGDVPDETEDVCDKLATAAVTAFDGPSETMDDAIVNHDAVLPTQKPRSSRSISFGTVSVREYARTLGTHVVPADGGWPLGLSDEVVAENRAGDGGGMDDVVAAGGGVGGGDGIGGSPDPSSPPRRRSRLRSRSDSLVGSPSSPLTVHCHQRPTSWTVDDFEMRRQIELRQRYAQLIRDQRRRKFEKEWEKRNVSAVHNRHGQGNNIRRGRSRSGSFGGSGVAVGGGGRSRAGSGSFKVEMTAEEREELDVLINRPVTLPNGELETRSYDYKKRVCHARKSKGGDSRGNNGGVARGGVDWQSDAPQHDCTEEDELYHDYGGRNPLFRAMREDDRRKVLLRDDHLMAMRRHCRGPMVDDSMMKADASPSKPIQKNDVPPSLLANDDDCAPLDPADGTVLQRMQHDLEALRIQRSDPSNLGCSCRKLHVFLPGSTDKSHHRKKTSHRRLPERKLREELRKRGLLHGGGGDENGASLSREDMEVMLHDAIENEPCCWGNDCPCWRNGIGCQADTCSCWHASHDVGGAGASNSSATKQDTAVMTSRCGNPHGLYIVDFDAIARYRGQHVITCIPIRVGE